MLSSLCATVGFSDIESSNTVGYTTKALRAGATMLAPCFKDVSKGGIDLTSISVSGYDAEEGTAGDVIVQVLSAYGKTTAKYYWNDFEEDGDVFKGWYDADDNLIEPNQVVFQPGDGLWVTGDNGLNLTFPGEVSFSDVSKALRKGNTPTGNMMAIAKDLTAISVSGYDSEEGTAGDVIVQVLSAYGKTTAKYFWNDFEEDGDVFKGWYDASDEEVTKGSVVFQPGDGLWVTGDEGFFLDVTAPEL